MLIGGKDGNAYGSQGAGEARCLLGTYSFGLRRPYGTNAQICPGLGEPLGARLTVCHRLKRNLIPVQGTLLTSRLPSHGAAAISWEAQ